MNKIPKKIFFYYVGDKLPWMRYMSLYSFRKLNPDWEITLYTNKNIGGNSWNSKHTQDYMYFDNDDYYDELLKLNIIIKDIGLPDTHKLLLNENPIYISDVFRYYKLYEDGGFYSDTDILFIKSMDELYNNITQNKYNTIIYQQSYIAIGFLGANKGNEFFKDLFEKSILYKNNDKNYQKFGVNFIRSIYGSNPMSTMVGKFNTLKPYTLKENDFYKYGWMTIKKMFTPNNGVDIESFDDVIGYHWYGGDKENIVSKYNNILTHENYEQHDITFCNLIKKLMNI